MENHKTIFVAAVIAAVVLSVVGFVNLACDGEEGVSYVFLGIGD